MGGKRTFGTPLECQLLAESGPAGSNGFRSLSDKEFGSNNTAATRNSRRDRVLALLARAF